MKYIIDLRSEKKIWGDNFFEKVGHLETPIYTRETGKPCTCPGQDTLRGRPERTPELYNWLILGMGQMGNEV